MYQKYIKRLLDIVLSLAAILCLLPVYLVVAVLVRIKLGSPVLFTQPRPGKDGKVFKMYKFRSMTDERDTEGNLLSDEIRLTEFGKKLRSTSLDELPELFNILKGDMSIVGPRPQLVRDMVFMNADQNRRHSVRQGLTGLAQIRGRNNISWEDKLRYDIEYVDNISFVNDVKIILGTVRAVFVKDGITTEGMATAEDFGDYLLREGKVSSEDYDVKIKKANDILDQEIKGVIDMRRIHVKKETQEGRLTLSVFGIYIKENLLKCSLMFLTVVVVVIVTRYIQRSNSENITDEFDSSLSTYIETINQLEAQLEEYQKYNESAYVMEINAQEAVKNVLIVQLVNKEDSDVNTLAAWNACKWFVEDLIYEKIQEELSFELTKDDFLRIFSVIYMDESQTMKISITVMNESEENEIVVAVKKLLENYCKERANVFSEYAFVIADEYQMVCGDEVLLEYQDSINALIRETQIQIDVNESYLTIAEKEALTGEKIAIQRLIDNWGIDFLVAVAIGFTFCSIYIIHVLEKKHAG